MFVAAQESKLQRSMENVVVKRAHPSFPVTFRGEIIPKAAGRARGEQVPMAQLGHGMHEVSQIHGDGAGASSHLAHCSRHLCQGLPYLYIFGVTNSPRNLLPFYTEVPFFNPSKQEKLSQALFLGPVPCLGVAKMSFAGELNSQHGKM